MSAHARRGVVFALLAYTMWGLFPLYFKLLKSVTPLEILSHRVIWSLAVMVGVLAVKRHWAWLWALRRAWWRGTWPAPPCWRSTGAPTSGRSTTIT